MVNIVVQEGEEHMGLLGGHGIELVIVFFGYILPLVIAALWLMGVIEASTKERIGSEDKVVWLMIILFVPGVGTLLYYLIRRPARMRLYGE
jgi:hypothetical protein